MEKVGSDGESITVKYTKEEAEVIRDVVASAIDAYVSETRKDPTMEIPVRTTVLIDAYMILNPDNLIQQDQEA